MKIWNFIRNIVEKLGEIFLKAAAVGLRDKIVAKVEAKLLEMEDAVRAWKMTVWGIEISVGSQAWEQVILPNIPLLKEAVQEAVDEAVEEL